VRRLCARQFDASRLSTRGCLGPQTAKPGASCNAWLFAVEITFAREIAPGTPGRNESHLRFGPKRFLFGAQAFLFNLLQPLGDSHLSYSQFFSYDGKLGPPSLKGIFARGGNQLRDRQLKLVREGRLDEVRLRARANVSRMSCA
jgi:hypothetical protein